MAMMLRIYDLGSDYCSFTLIFIHSKDTNFTSIKAFNNQKEQQQSTGRLE